MASTPFHSNTSLDRISRADTTHVEADMLLVARFTAGSLADFGEQTLSHVKTWLVGRRTAMCSQPGRWMIVAIQVIISSQVLAQLHFLAVPFPSTGRTKGDRFCRSGLGSLLTNRR